MDERSDERSDERLDERFDERSDRGLMKGLMKQNDFVIILPRQNVVIQYIMSEVTSYSRAMSMLRSPSETDGSCGPL